MAGRGSVGAWSSCLSAQWGNRGVEPVGAAKSAMLDCCRFPGLPSEGAGELA